MQKYSIFNLVKNAFSNHQNWDLAWKDPTPKKEYDVVIIGGGGHGLATAYYLAKEHNITNVAIIEKGWIGGGNVGRNTTIIRSNYMHDDNALFRRPEILKLRDLNEEDPKEIEASKHDLAYIKLDGSIGCMVNGAGLAMATMDIIKLYGQEPANFLDVGGGASKEKVSEAFKIILSDKNVKGILVNIFGGIMRCDIIAEGVVTAAKEMNINVPLVVRLSGTNSEEGKKILDSSDLKIISASDLSDAAEKIIKSIE